MAMPSSDDEDRPPLVAARQPAPAAARWRDGGRAVSQTAATALRPDALAGLRILKKIAPDARGAKLLAAEFGANLVCVRHRLDPTASRRLTTVELVIAERPIAQKPSPTVSLKLEFHERTLRARVLQAGGRWDQATKLWRLRRATAVALGLKSRIVR